MGAGRAVAAAAGFAGRLVEWTRHVLGIIVHIAGKPQGRKAFSVLPRRWAVERTLAWVTAHRRLARDYERLPAHSEAMIRWAAINTMTRSLARGRPATRHRARPSNTPDELTSPTTLLARPEQSGLRRHLTQ